MTRDELEDRLRQLGTDWPVPSVADAVLARVDSRPAPRSRWVPLPRRRPVLVAATAALVALVVTAAWLCLLATPRTLHAQVQQALAKASTAHVVIAALDEKGVRRHAEIWYERGHGFRAETPDEVILDDGRQQWTWRPGTDDSDLVIARRPSGDAVSLITGMFQLGGAPAAWSQQRAAEHDRAVDSRPCRGFVVTSPTSQVPSADGSTLVPDPHPPRFVVLIDPDERIVYLEEQRQVDDRWQAGREVSIAYDVKVPAEKLAVHLPRGRVIDADRVLAERFPLDRALGRAEEGGLLFAVHDVLPGADDTVYVVSSVRGTAEYLKAHPPQPRRLNLQTTILDVAEQQAGSVDQDCHRVALACAEADGVHYLWWLAARRHYFTVEKEGKRTPLSKSPSLEGEPGKVQLPLQAGYRGPKAGSDLVNVSVEVSLPEDRRARPLADIAVRTRRDLLLVGQGPGAVASLYRWVRDGELRHVAPEQITDADYAKGVSRQLQWLRSSDEISGASMDMGPGGRPGPPNGR
jgi:hypothetical protein